MKTAERPRDPFKRLFTYPLIRHSEMSEEMKEETLRLCTSSCESFPDNNQSAAQLMKETLDRRYGGSWHAVVGEQFGLEISHETGSILYMFCGNNLAVCVWRCS